MPRPLVSLPPDPELEEAFPLSHGQILDLLRESKDELSWMAQRAEARLQHAEQFALNVSFGTVCPEVQLLPEQPAKSQWSTTLDDMPRVSMSQSEQKSQWSLEEAAEPEAALPSARSKEGKERKDSPEKKVSEVRSEESTGKLQKERSAVRLAPPEATMRVTFSEAAQSKEPSASLAVCADEEEDSGQKALLASSRRQKFAQSGNIISRDLERAAVRREPFFRRLIRSRAFDTAVALLIFLNAVFMGAQVDYGDERQNSLPLLLGSIVFTGLFVLELFLRILGDGCLFWLREPPWNIIDTAVTICSVVELALRLTTWHGRHSNMAIFRTLRMLRFVRAARVLRVVHFFRELRLMVFSIGHSLRSIFWALVLLLMTTFMFGISLAQGVRDVVEQQPEEERLRPLQFYFGSVTRTMFTLFQAVLGGFSWAELTDRLREVGWGYEFLFCSFIAFTVLALLNVVTGVFVDGALRSAAQDRDIAIQDQVMQEGSYAQELRRLFCEADLDESGSLSLEEFLLYLKDDRVQSYLRALGIDPAEAEGLFHLLDLDDSGSVETEEFIAGCLRFKGEAKGVDVFMLMYENKRMVLAIISALEAIAADIKVMRGNSRRPSALASVGGIYRRIQSNTLPCRSPRSGNNSRRASLHSAGLSRHSSASLIR